MGLSLGGNQGRLVFVWKSTDYQRRLPSSHREQCLLRTFWTEHYHKFCFLCQNRQQKRSHLFPLPWRWFQGFVQVLTLLVVACFVSIGVLCLHNHHYTHQSGSQYRGLQLEASLDQLGQCTLFRHFFAQMQSLRLASSGFHLSKLVRLLAHQATRRCSSRLRLRLWLPQWRMF